MNLVRAYGLSGRRGEDFGHHEAGHGIVHRRRGTEYDLVTAQLVEVMEQLDRFGDVFAVIFIGHLGRLRHDDQRRAVHGGLDIGMIVEDLLQGSPVADVGLVEDAVAGKLGLTGDQVIHDDRGVARIDQSGSNRAADIPGSAGDEEFHINLQDES